MQAEMRNISVLGFSACLILETWRYLYYSHSSTPRRVRTPYAGPTTPTPGGPTDVHVRPPTTTSAACMGGASPTTTTITIPTASPRQESVVARQHQLPRQPASHDFTSSSTTGQLIGLKYLLVKVNSGFYCKRDITPLLTFLCNLCGADTVINILGELGHSLCDQVISGHSID